MGPIINWQVRRHSGNEKGKKSRIGASFTKKRHPEHLNSVAFNTLNNKFISNIQCGQKATFFAGIFWNLTYQYLFKDFINNFQPILETFC